MRVEAKVNNSSRSKSYRILYEYACALKIVYSKNSYCGKNMVSIVVTVL